MGASVILTAVNIFHSASAHDTSRTSLDPERRRVAFSGIFSIWFAQTDYPTNVEMTHTLIPKMTKLLRPSNETVKANLNECDWQKPGL